ncbi:hypothetical protein L6452_24715 [Arctium lappa]|uniref:Uncharacterized protein n=1 Tax=Arctium lappa TaxID=4217 RepID=A0ACB9A985_ARCLA|nr:hypothetical protein L6452_24715 [Arctium lappa]
MPTVLHSRLSLVTGSSRFPTGFEKRLCCSAGDTSWSPLWVVTSLDREAAQGIVTGMDRCWRLIQTSPVACICGAGKDCALKTGCGLADVPFSFGFCSLAGLSSLSR